MALTIGTSVDMRGLKKLLVQVGREAVWAEQSALRATARKGRVQYVRRMSSKLAIPQSPIRSRCKFYVKKPDLRKGIARAKMWVGGKRAITEKDTPKVLSSPGLLGRPFEAIMPNGKRGRFVRARDWETGPRNPYRRISRHYFKRPDKQNTYLPIEFPKLLLTTKESQDTLEDSGRQAMDNDYPKQLKKELETRIKRLRKRQVRRGKRALGRTLRRL